MTLKRRHLLFSLAASCSTLYFHPAIAWIEYAGQVVSFAANAIASKETKTWQSDVSNKLDDILNNQKAILDEIRSLRVHIDEEFANSRSRQLTEQIIAKKRMLDVAMASAETIDSIPKYQIDKIRFIANEAENEAFQLMQLGPAGYQAVLCGFLILAEVYKLLRYEAASFKALCDQYLSYLRKCVSQDMNGSFQERASYAERIIPEYTSYIETFRARSGRFLVSRHPLRPGRGVSLGHWGAASYDGAGGWWLTSFDYIQWVDHSGLPFPTAPGFDLIVAEAGPAREHAYKICESATAKNKELIWASNSLQSLKKALLEINVSIVSIEKMKTSYKV